MILYIISAAETSTEGMIERCVVVQRQSDGYGFTVTGDHPVFVHTVKPEGAAFCAGVREGDRILKVRHMFTFYMFEVFSNGSMVNPVRR